MSQSLSIVIVGRNDNYGGSFNKNLRQFLKTTTSLLPDAEIVIVDWNPPEDNPPLAQMFPWPHKTRGQIITVPGNIHDQIENKENLPMLEYYAKNVGIRRADGDFVLCTNPDTLISNELAEELKQELDHFAYYRANRTDVQSIPYPIYDVDSIQQFAEENILIKHRKWGSYNGANPIPYSLAFLRRIKRYYRYHTLSVPHENAAGDFLLAAKETWYEVGGYPELSRRAHIDSIAMCLMHRNVKKLEALHKPLSYVFKGTLYHQDHERRPFSMDPWTDATKQEIMRHGMSFRTYNWGLFNQDLPTEVKA